MECALTARETARIVMELCPRRRGGLTPSLGVLRGVRERITIPVRPIIRPRGGEFYYATANLP